MSKVTQFGVEIGAVCFYSWLGGLLLDTFGTWWVAGRVGTTNAHQ